MGQNGYKTKTAKITQSPIRLIYKLPGGDKSAWGLPCGEKMCEEKPEKPSITITSVALVQGTLA